MAGVMARIEKELLGRPLVLVQGMPIVTGVGLLTDIQGRPYIELRTDAGDPHEVQALIARQYHVQTDVIRVVPGLETRAFRAPISLGDAVGHYACNCFGTVGPFLFGGPTRILSNRHVLALRGMQSIGDPVVDAHGMVVGRVEFVAPFHDPATDVDVAVAQLITDRTPQVTTWIAPGDAAVGELVTKRGARTGTTLGFVRSAWFSVSVMIEGERRTFLRQIAVSGLGGAFSDSGDSGSLVSKGFDPSVGVGLLFAGDTAGPPDSRFTFLHPLSRVIAALPWSRRAF